MDTETIQQPSVDCYIVVSLSYINQGGHRDHTPACCWPLHWWTRWVTKTKVETETIHQPFVDCYVGGYAGLQWSRWTQRPFTSLLLTATLVVSSSSNNQGGHRDNKPACCCPLHWWSRCAIITKVDTEIIHQPVADCYIGGLAELHQPSWRQRLYTSMLLTATLVVSLSYNNQCWHRDHTPACCWPLHWWSLWVPTTKVDT